MEKCFGFKAGFKSISKFAKNYFMFSLFPKEDVSIDG